MSFTIAILAINKSISSTTSPLKKTTWYRYQLTFLSFINSLRLLSAFSILSTEKTSSSKSCQLPENAKISSIFLSWLIVSFRWLLSLVGFGGIFFVFNNVKRKPCCVWSNASSLPTPIRSEKPTQIYPRAKFSVFFLLRRCLLLSFDLRLTSTP